METGWVSPPSSRVLATGYLGRIKLDELMSATHEDEGDDRGDEGSNKAPSRYDNTDMGDMNGLIMEYRRLNLNESKGFQYDLAHLI